MATAQPTTDPNEIRQWVEARGGHPARVKQTGSRKDPGVLRIDFPGFSGEDTLEEIEWDEFFEWFNRNRLAMLLSDEEGNRFNKLVSRSTARKSTTKKSSARKSSTKKSSSKKSSTKKSSAKKSSSKKSSAKKSSAKKSSAKKASPRKAASAKKSSAKKSSAKKATASRKPASAKKSSAKKSSAKKSSAKKASPSRRVAAATTARKASAKKAGAKRSASSTTTTDHDEIRKWVESRGGFPAHVKQTGRKRGDLGVLRIDYPGYSGRDTLERIDWEQWLDAFDRNKLAFLYQNKRGSRFSKLVNR